MIISCLIVFLCPLGGRLIFIFLKAFNNSSLSDVGTDVLSEASLLEIDLLSDSDNTTLFRTNKSIISTFNS